jgi:hypothetical protein
MVRTLKRMEVIQQISSRYTVPNLDGKTGTVEAYVIEPKRDYTLKFSRINTLTWQDNRTLYFIDEPYNCFHGVMKCKHHSNHSNHYCIKPEIIVIVDSDNGKETDTLYEGDGIQIFGDQNEITFKIVNHSPDICNNCNIIWLSVTTLKFNRYKDDHEEISEETITIFPKE